MTGTNETFTCAMCGETYTKVRSDEEAMAEADEIFGEELGDDPEIVCDPCWRQYMGLPPADEDVEAALEQRDLP